MASTRVGALDGLYPRLLSFLDKQSVEDLHHQPKAWLRSHNTDIASIVTEYSGAVPILRGENSVTAVQRCLFPRTWILRASFSSTDEADATEVRQLLDWQNQLDPRLLLSSYRDAKEQLRQLFFLSIRGVTCAQAAGCTPQKLEDLMQLDALHLAALVLTIIADGETREKLIGRHDSEQDKEVDQNILDLLYALLGVPELETCHDTIIRALVELSKNTSLFPQHLVYCNVKDLSQFPVAEGSFGSVYIGNLDGQTVAVKLLKRSVANVPKQEIVRGYSREAILWSQLHHTNVLPFYGVYLWESRGDCRIGLLSPWMKNGNLCAYLRDNGDADKVALILDVAQGLRYLHTRKPAFIHGDLKPNNILVTPTGTACLADFGLGRLAPNDQWSSTSIRGGPLAFWAPELFKRESELDGSYPRKTTETDVYAFACLCYEIFSPGKSSASPLPFHIGGARVTVSRTKPASMEEKLWAWLTRMWDDDPTRRPSMQDFLDGFNRGLSWPRQQHTWDPAATARLRSISLVRSDSLIFTGDGPGTAYRVSPDPICSSSTLITVDSGRESAPAGSQPSGIALPSAPTSPPPYATNIRPLASSPPSYVRPPRSGTDPSLPPYRTQEYASRPLASPSQPRIIRDVERITFNGDDIIIALMGPSGTGKSTFINNALGKDVAAVGHGVTVCTQKVQIYGCDHPLRPTRRVFFVDTPGMEDSERSDRKTLKLIAKWLKKTYRDNITLTGILHFHRITDARLGGSNRANLEVFQEICGREALKNVIFVTTGWEDESTIVTGPDRERELLSRFLQGAMDNGCQYERFLKRDLVHSWAIVDKLPDEEGRALKIQTEMLRWRWDQTSASKALKRRFAVLMPSESRSAAGSSKPASSLGGPPRPSSPSSSASNQSRRTSSPPYIRPPQSPPSSPPPLNGTRDPLSQSLASPEPCLDGNVDCINLSEDDIIIALVGPSGTGKSTFINTALRREVAAVGHRATVATQGVQIYRCDHPLRPARRVFFVDTPGMEDSERSDQKTLEIIAKWLKDIYKENIALTGVLHFHRITDARPGSSNQAKFEVFQEMCGREALRNVIFVTTGWEDIDTIDTGVDQERELSKFLRGAMDQGCQYERFLKRDSNHAWAIIDKLPEGKRRPLLIQREMQECGWDQTSASKALKRRFAVLMPAN